MRFLKSLFGRATEPEPSREESLAKTLRELGLPLDFSDTDPEAALTGGFAKASIFHGYKSLKAGELDKAISAFTSVIDFLMAKGGPRWVAPLAVAHYLRGSAHEQKHMIAEARKDYASALGLSPDQFAAREGLKRLGGS